MESTKENKDALAQEHDEGFEALLKPIQDVLTKNWEISLTRYLENYLNKLRIGMEPTMNFSEAALLLQNSTHCYCKRVDLVFDFMTKLINTLERGHRGGDEDVDGGEGTSSKRKKATKNLLNEELILLGNVYSEHNIDINWDKIGENSERKHIVLNDTVVAINKPDTSCPIYETKGAQLGLKDEFRLNWRISNDGTLYEDFNANCANTMLKRCSASDDSEDGDSDDDFSVNDGGCVNDEVDDRDESSMDKIMRECPEEEPEPNLLQPGLPPQQSSPFLPSPTPDQSSATHQPISSGTRRKRGNTAKKSTWDTILENVKISMVPRKKKVTYKLPKNFKETKKRSTEEERAEENEGKGGYRGNYLCHRQLIEGGELPVTEHLIIKERRNKSAQLLMRRKQNREAELRAAQEFEGDFAGFYSDSDCDEFEGLVDGEVNNENCVDECDDDDLGGALPVIDVGHLDVSLAVGDTPRDGGTYEMDAYVVIEQFKASVKFNGNLVTEIARRVAAWHEALEPVLEAAKARTNFDVHEYETHILDVFPTTEEAPIISFADVVRGKPKEEICRYFLSILSLANTNNVEIIKSDSSDLSKDCMNLKLLGRARHHEEMDNNLRATAHTQQI